jgi:hypothetical protein
MVTFFLAHNLQKTLAMGSKAGAEEILQTLLTIRAQGKID